MPFPGIFYTMVNTFMSETYNPYQSPETEVVPEKPLITHGVLTETMLLHLKKASPWLRFVGIAGFVLSGMAVLTGLVVLPITSRSFTDIPGFEQTGSFAMIFSIGTAVYGVGAAALFFFLSLNLYRFGDKIRSYLATGVDQDLEIAFKNNSKFWKMLGILFIISLAFVPITIISSIIVVVATFFT